MFWSTTPNFSSITLELLYYWSVFFFCESMILSVRKIVSFYRCKACFLDELNGKVRPITAACLVGKILHEAYIKTLNAEISLLERSKEGDGLSFAYLKDRYCIMMKRIASSVLLRYRRKLMELGEDLSGTSRMLNKFCANVTEARTRHILRKIEYLGVQELMSKLRERKLEEILLSSKYGVMGSPDIIEDGILYELKYSRPSRKGRVRKDFLLQVVWYSILSGIEEAHIVYLPSLRSTRIKIHEELLAWAHSVRLDLLEFLERPYIAEHTCRSGKEFVTIRSDSHGEDLPALVVNSASTL